MKLVKRVWFEWMAIPQRNGGFQDALVDVWSGSILNHVEI